MEDSNILNVVALETSLKDNLVNEIVYVLDSISKKKLFAHILDELKVGLSNDSALEFEEFEDIIEKWIFRKNEDSVKSFDILINSYTIETLEQIRNILKLVYLRLYDYDNSGMLFYTAFRIYEEQLEQTRSRKNKKNFFEISESKNYQTSLNITLAKMEGIEALKGPLLGEATRLAFNIEKINKFAASINITTEEVRKITSQEDIPNSYKSANLTLINRFLIQFNNVSRLLSEINLLVILKNIADNNVKIFEILNGESINSVSLWHIVEELSKNIITESKKSKKTSIKAIFKKLLIERDGINHLMVKNPIFISRIRRILPAIIQAIEPILVEQGKLIRRATVQLQKIAIHAFRNDQDLKQLNIDYPRKIIFDFYQIFQGLAITESIFGRKFLYNNNYLFSLIKTIYLDILRIKVPLYEYLFPANKQKTQDKNPNKDILTFDQACLQVESLLRGPHASSLDKLIQKQSAIEELFNNFFDGLVRKIPLDIAIYDSILILGFEIIYPHDTYGEVFIDTTNFYKLIFDKNVNLPVSGIELKVVHLVQVYFEAERKSKIISEKLKEIEGDLLGKSREFVEEKLMPVVKILKIRSRITRFLYLIRNFLVSDDAQKNRLSRYSSLLKFFKDLKDLYDPLYDLLDQVEKNQDYKKLIKVNFFIFKLSEVIEAIKIDYRNLNDFLWWIEVFEKNKIHRSEIYDRFIDLSSNVFQRRIGHYKSYDGAYKFEYLCQLLSGLGTLEKILSDWKNFEIKKADFKIFYRFIPLEGDFSYEPSVFFESGPLLKYFLEIFYDYLFYLLRINFENSLFRFVDIRQFEFIAESINLFDQSIVHAHANQTTSPEEIKTGKFIEISYDKSLEALQVFRDNNPTRRSFSANLEDFFKNLIALQNNNSNNVFARSFFNVMYDDFVKNRNMQLCILINFLRKKFDQGVNKESLSILFIIADSISESVDYDDQDDINIFNKFLGQLESKSRSVFINAIFSKLEPEKSYKLLISLKKYYLLSIDDSSYKIIRYPLLSDILLNNIPDRCVIDACMSRANFFEVAKFVEELSKREPDLFKRKLNQWLECILKYWSDHPLRNTIIHYFLFVAVTNKLSIAEILSDKLKVELFYYMIQHDKQIDLKDDAVDHQSLFQIFFQNLPVFEYGYQLLEKNKSSDKKSTRKYSSIPLNQEYYALYFYYLFLRGDESSLFEVFDQLIQKSIIVDMVSTFPLIILARILLYKAQHTLLNDGEVETGLLLSLQSRASALPHDNVYAFLMAYSMFKEAPRLLKSKMLERVYGASSNLFSTHIKNLLSTARCFAQDYLTSALLDAAKKTNSNIRTNLIYKIKHESNVVDIYTDAWLITQHKPQVKKIVATLLLTMQSPTIKTKGEKISDDLWRKIFYQSPAIIQLHLNYLLNFCEQKILKRSSLFVELLTKSEDPSHMTLIVAVFARRKTFTASMLQVLINLVERKLCQLLHADESAVLESNARVILSCVFNLCVGHDDTDDSDALLKNLRLPLINIVLNNVKLIPLFLERLFYSHDDESSLIANSFSSGSRSQKFYENFNLWLNDFCSLPPNNKPIIAQGVVSYLNATLGDRFEEKYRDLIYSKVMVMLIQSGIRNYKLKNELVSILSGQYFLDKSDMVNNKISLLRLKTLLRKSLSDNHLSFSGPVEEAFATMEKQLDRRSNSVSRLF